MNRLVLVLGSAALLAALLAAGYALAQGAFAIAPVSATLFTQGDGQCRGHITYAIAPTDDTIATDVDVETGSIEIRSGCARLTSLVSGETWDTKAGKLDVTVKGAAVEVLATDPDGDGPRAAGECSLSIFARVRPSDPAMQRVFKPRDVTRVRAAPACAPLTNLIDNSCWVARGAWPADAPFPTRGNGTAIPQCAP